MTTSDEDADIQIKVLIASELVMNHYKRKTVPEDWMLTTSPITYCIPFWAQAATLLALGELYSNRESSIVNILSDAVKALIPRTPTLG